MDVLTVTIYTAANILSMKGEISGHTVFFLFLTVLILILINLKARPLRFRRE